MYPNPVEEILYIAIDESIQVQIVDLFGKVISKRELQIGKNQINASKMDAGIYFIVTDKGESIKFIKK